MAPHPTDRRRPGGEPPSHRGPQVKRWVTLDKQRRVNSRERRSLRLKRVQGRRNRHIARALDVWGGSVSRVYRIACETPRRKLRYLTALLAKKIVLHSFPAPQLAPVLERLVEVLTITERRLERG